MNPLVAEKKDNAPILIVDRAGIIGNALAEKLSGDTQVVLVSEKQTSLDNVIFVPFTKRFPVIPDSIYSHIFVIDDEDSVTGDSLSSFLKKAQNDRSVLVIASHIKNQNLINNALLEHRGTRMAFFGDIVDKNIVNNSQAFKFINQARARGRIDVPGDGMEICYPLFFEDFILGILESAFGTSVDKIYYLFPKHGVTLLSFAHMIQKSNPSISVDFTKLEKPQNISMLGEGKYLLPTNYPLEEKIRNLKIEVSSSPLNLEKVKKEKAENNYENKKIFRTTIFFLIFFIFMPLISTLFLLLFGTVFLNSAKITLNSANFGTAGKSVDIAKSFFSLSKKTSSFLVWETAGLGISKSLETIAGDGYKTSLGLEDFFRGVELLSENKTAPAVESFKNFLIFVQREKANNKNLDFFDDGLFNLAASTVDVWPQILAFDSPKNYLVLLQNNLKLRSTGGKIESFGILKMDKGKINSFLVSNAYNSNKIKGHVEPPFPVRRYLGEKDWFLKDSNFDVDFSQNASSAAFFVNLETGGKIDGVIGMDLNFIKNILKFTGPIYIDDYKRSIDSNNLFQVAQEKLEDNNFATLILSSIKTTFESKKISYLGLASSIGGMFQQKNILLASSDTNVQNTFTVNNLSGSLWDERTDSPKNINDFVGINETSLDVSKPSQIVARKLSQVVDIKEDGTISANLTLEFQNSAVEDYKNYLRFILPGGIQIKTIKIDGVEQALANAITDPQMYEENSFKPTSGLEVQSYEEKGKTIVGFMVVVPKGTHTVQIVYDLAKKPPLESIGNFSYSLRFFKQPGVDSYPFDLVLTTPSSYKTLNFPKNVSGNGDKISFSKNSSEDFELNLDFSQK